MRTDIPPRLFRAAADAARATSCRRRLLAKAKPETQTEIRRVLAQVTDEVAAKAAPRSYVAGACRRARDCTGQHKLGESDIAEFAQVPERYEETIAALATLCAVPRRGCRQADERRTRRSGPAFSRARRVSAGRL